MGARIFISHSCKDRAANPGPALLYARLVRDRIVQKLQSAGHTVWLDLDSLVPGDSWRARLHEWLGCCDGAVILLDKTSVTSSWLRKEATILGWRRSLQDDLRVIPVFLGDFGTTDLEKYDYGSLDVDPNQAARLVSPQLTDANATELADQVLAGFAGLLHGRNDTPMSRWIGRVAALIGAVRDPLYVEQAAVYLDLEDADWAHFSNRAAALARQLLHLGLGKGLAALDMLEQGMNDEDFAELAGLCLPTWVDGDAAADLNAALAANPRPVIAVNSDSSEIGREYIGRALCWPQPDRRFVPVSDPVGEGAVDELLPRYENSMRRSLGIRPDKPAALRTALEREHLERYVLLTGDAADPDVAAALQQRYPKATFVLLPGTAWTEGIQAQARIVRPELDERQLEELDDLRRELDRMKDT